MVRPVNIHTHQCRTTETTIRTVGIHPYDAAKADEGLVAELELGAAEADAVGEIGLDFAVDADRDTQRVLFARQLAIAERLHKPIVVHCVRAFEPVMDMLRDIRVPAVIFHGFIGSAEQAQRAIERGYYLSFGERTLRSPKSIEALRSIPLARVFVETDDSPTPIEELYDRIAALLDISAEELMLQTRENFEHIFGKR